MIDNEKINCLNKLKNQLNNESNLLNLLNDETFIAIIDNLFPSNNLIERYLLSNDFFSVSNKNLHFSIDLNRIIQQINTLCLKYNNILLYGNSNFTKIVKPLFKNKIVGIIDKEIGMDTILPSEIYTKEFDCIIVMVLGRENEIYDLLINKYNISPSRIIILDLQ